MAVALAASAPGAASARHKHHHAASEAEPAAEAAAEPPPVAQPQLAPAPVAQPPVAQPKPATASVAPPQLPAPALPTPAPGAPTRVSFGPAAPGTGSVTVKGDNLQVSFDGRPIGVSPLTITDIPKGDYVVEGTGPDGKQVSRPVTIEDSVEAVVDLGAGKISTAELGAPGVVDEGHPKLMMASKVMLGVSAGALLVGAVFGVLELKQHGDYESAPANQAMLDSMARTGHSDALIANISFVACGASLIASGVLALPSLIKSEHPAPEPTTTAFVSTGATRGSAMAGFSMRF
jgi:hypothetical protein